MMTNWLVLVSSPRGGEVVQVVAVLLVALHWLLSVVVLVPLLLLLVGDRGCKWQIRAVRLLEGVLFAMASGGTPIPGAAMEGLKCEPGGCFNCYCTSLYIAFIPILDHGNSPATSK